MTGATHRIRRQRWQLSAPDAASALALRGELRRALDTTLLPAFERAFTQHAAGDEVLHLPRLEIRLAVRDLDQLATQLPALIAEQLDAALARAGNAERGRAQLRAPVLVAREHLFHYLATGQLAWSEAAAPVASALARLREAAEHLAAAVDCSAQLEAAQPAARAARFAFFQRLLALLPARTQTALAEAWLATVVQAGGLIETPVRRAALQALHEQPASVGVRAVLLTWLAERTPPRTQAEATADLPVAAQASVPQAFDVLCPAAVRAAMQPGQVPAPRAAHLAAHASEPAPAAHAVVSPQPVVQPEPDAPFAPAVLARVQPAERDAPAERVEAAGLVLAHPFLHAFLQAGRVLEESAQGPRIAPAQLPRAACLLHLLACGRDEVFEFELGFIKLLLGLAPADPLVVDPQPFASGVLTAADRDECAALLDALRTHWAALGGTSAAGLQSSFLQRAGYLRLNDAGWQLQLESLSFDMLLAQLPWSISLVKLPWMTRPIFTDWPTP